MPRPDRDATLIPERVLDHISQEARTWVLDSVYCSLHNAGNDLQGNTAESDLDWFARELYARDRQVPHWHFEQVLGDAERDHWRRLARLALETLPLLMGRIGSRCERHAQALRGLLQAERKRPAETGQEGE